jgi:hypothetical protein
VSDGAAHVKATSRPVAVAVKLCGTVVGFGIRVCVNVPEVPPELIALVPVAPILPETLIDLVPSALWAIPVLPLAISFEVFPLRKSKPKFPPYPEPLMFTSQRTLLLLLKDWLLEQ